MRYMSCSAGITFAVLGLLFDDISSIFFGIALILLAIFISIDSKS